jgi:hypothetical protein
MAMANETERWVSGAPILCRSAKVGTSDRFGGHGFSVDGGGGRARQWQCRIARRTITVAERGTKQPLPVDRAASPYMHECDRAETEASMAILVDFQARCKKRTNACATEARLASYIGFDDPQASTPYFGSKGRASWQNAPHLLHDELAAAVYRPDGAIRCDFSMGQKHLSRRPSSADRCNCPPKPQPRSLCMPTQHALPFHRFCVKSEVRSPARMSPT